MVLSESKSLKTAAVKALDTVAFDSAEAIVLQASKDLNFVVNAKRAMGLQVKRASIDDMDVAVYTTRGWLFYHLNEGVRQARSSSWRFNGKSYLMIPVEHKAFTRKKKLKAGYRSGIYIVPYGIKALVFYRRKKGSRKSELIAVLVPKARYKVDTRPDLVMDRVFKEKFERLFRFHLGKERSKEIARRRT